VRGVDPVLESRVSAIGERMRSGSIAALEPGAYRVLLGAEVATRLGVETGDTVVLAIAQGTVTPAGVVPRMRRFTVGGVFYSGMYEIDNGLALVHIEDAARLFRAGRTSPDCGSPCVIRCLRPRVSREVAQALGGGLWVEDWTQRHANFFRSIELTKRMMFFILLLVVAVAAFNIVSTLVMAVKDKQPDIAILRTLRRASRQRARRVRHAGHRDRVPRHRRRRRARRRAVAEPRAMCTASNGCSARASWTRACT
jgi:lipoprotein-releasing system permease protein